MSPEISGGEEWVYFPEWVRGPARIEDGAVVLEEGRAQGYALRDVDQVILELAALRSPEDVVSFVGRHGLLVRGPTSYRAGKGREPLDDWTHAVRHAYLTTGLYRALREAARTGSATPVRSFFEGRAWEGDQLPRDDEECLAFIGKKLAEILSVHVSRCSNALIPAFALEGEAGPGEFVFLHRPPDLLAAAHTSFASLVGRRVVLLLCAGCPRLFYPESGKQKYHNKACASTDRGRRLRERRAK